MQQKKASGLLANVYNMAQLILLTNEIVENDAYFL